MGYIYGVRYIGNREGLSERSTNNLCRKWCYIGQAVDFQRRWNAEKRAGKTLERDCPKFYDTLRSFGVENFVWEVLVIVPDEDMDTIEDDYIVKYSLSPNGLNLRRGGKRGKYTQELRDKTSMAQKKRFESVEARQKNREAQKLAYANPELRASHRSIRLAWLQTAAGIANRNAHSDYMKNRSDKKVQQQAGSLKAFYQTPEGKAHAAAHAVSHSAIMKASPKAQAHMKKLNELLAERRKNKPPVIRRCDLCDHTFKTNGHLKRHYQSKKHQDNTAP